jgi:hypothetical protein
MGFTTHYAPDQIGNNLLRALRAYVWDILRPMLE